MAKNRRFEKRQTKEAPPVTDRSIWYTDLSALDPALKNEVWASMALNFMKRSGGSRLFLDPKKAALYRATDSLLLDEAVYKQLVDPKTPGGGGGKAEYFSSDWKANPIYIHLKNIVKAEIQKTGKELEVNMTDKFAKTRQMKENYRIIYQREYRNLVNALTEMLGLPKLSESQDPYKWAQKFNAENTAKGQENREQSDVIDKYSDLIKNQITDSQDLALYNELIYKGDYEMAFELGIKYYLFNLNKWEDRWADECIDDLMHFNKFCGEWHTDLITGRPVIERFVPELLHVSPFKRKDGEDITYYYIEYDIPFSDFTKQVGRNLSPEKLKQVFILNKSQGSRHGLDWTASFDLNNASLVRDNAMIRIGKAAFLSQDMSVFIENTQAGTLTQVSDITWQPMEDETHLNRMEKNYNVWRWWYYIPPTLSDANNLANYVWQSQFIFQLQKNQDQQRYGEDGRYSKSPLVIYDNSSQATFTDITQTFMTKINHSWHKFQNCLVNDFDASIFADDFVGGLVAAVDEDNNIKSGDPDNDTGGNGRDAFMEQWKMIQQGGKGFLKMRDNKTGDLILDPSKLVLQVKNGYLEKAEKYLGIILMQYDLLIKSLALSPMTAGEEVKPRTPVAAIEQSLKASDSATFFIQKPYEAVMKMWGERLIRYIIDIAKEAKGGFRKRFEEFMDNVGYANGLAVEGMEDVPPESVGMTVNYVDNTSKKEFVMQLAVEYVKTKQLDEDFLYLIMGTDNWKYAMVLMRMAIKNKKKELEKQAQQQHDMIMQQKEADLAIANALQSAKATATDQNIVTQGKVDEMINRALNEEKYKAQSLLKAQTDQQRKSENDQKAELKKQEETHKANLELQKPATA